MRARNMPVLMLVVAATLAGCGQKGPLYRESPEASSRPVEQASSASAQSEQADDQRAQSSEPDDALDE